MAKYSYNYNEDIEDDEEDFEPIQESKQHRRTIDQAPRMQVLSNSGSQLNETTLKYMIRDIVHEILREYVTRDDMYKCIDRVLDERIGKSKRSIAEDSYDQQYDEDDNEEDQLDESTKRLLESKKEKFNMDSDASLNSLFGGTAQDKALASKPTTFEEAITAIGGSGEDWVAEAGILPS